MRSVVPVRRSFPYRLWDWLLAIRAPKAGESGALESQEHKAETKVAAADTPAVIASR